MTIQIYKKSGRYLPLHFPAGFIRTELGSRLLAKMILQALQQKAQEEKQDPSGEGDAQAICPDERALGELLRALGRCLRSYRGLTLVEAKSAQGDFVRIVL